MTDEPLSPTAQETEAIRRLALTNDGVLLHRYLRRVLEAVLLTGDSGALLVQTGRRTLARDLMALMAENIEANRGRTDPSDTPILSGPASGIAVSGTGGARRRTVLTPGDGWSPDNDPGPGSPAGARRRRAS